MNAMSTYIIGDLQGCYDPFQKLLKAICFNPQKDTIWLVGDVINRGHDSLATLRYLYQNRDCIFTVLGNHDLHLLSCFYTSQAPKSSDTFHDVLLAPDAELLLNWLRMRPLCHLFKEDALFLSHAGLYPGWTIDTAITLGKEVSDFLSQATNESLKDFFGKMHGNTPSKWNDQLQDMDRFRFIINALTRMRFLDNDLNLEFRHKKSLKETPNTYQPWFSHSVILQNTIDIAFGHWASLEGKIAHQSNPKQKIYALDTGCVWGGPLTALCLENRKITKITP